MDYTIWEKAKLVFHEALEGEGPDRRRIVQAACGDDVELLAKVESLLAAHEEAGDFLAEMTVRSVGDGPLVSFESLSQQADQTDDDCADRELALLRAELGDRYEILRLIGRGGMGAVYLAREISLDRTVALKVLPADAVGSSKTRERFRREARMAARLNHPSIVPLFSFGETESTLYYAMGYVEGESLKERIDRLGTLPADEILALVKSLCEALDHAHRRGVIHRDVKPPNILIDGETGRVLLTDFGIGRAYGVSSGDRAPGSLGENASLTRTGAVMGTPAYMAPEQAKGSKVDARSDLYSLALTVYEAATGGLPFTSPDLDVVLAKKLQGDYPPLKKARPDLAPGVSKAVGRCLHPVPSRRPDTAERVLALLEGMDRRVSVESVPLMHGRRRFLLPASLIATAATVTVLTLTPRSHAPEQALSVLSGVPEIPHSGPVMEDLRWGLQGRQRIWTELIDSLGKLDQDVARMRPTPLMMRVPSFAEADTSSLRHLRANNLNGDLVFLEHLAEQVQTHSPPDPEAVLRRIPDEFRSDCERGLCQILLQYSIPNSGDSVRFRWDFYSDGHARDFSASITTRPWSWHSRRAASVDAYLLFRMFPSIDSPVDRAVFVERGARLSPSRSFDEELLMMDGLLTVDPLEAPFEVPALDSLLAYIQDLRSLETTVPGFFLRYGNLSRAEAIADLDAIVERDKTHVPFAGLNIPLGIVVVVLPVVLLALLFSFMLHIRLLNRTLPERVPKDHTVGWPVLYSGLGGSLFLWVGILAWPTTSSVLLFLRQVSDNSLGENHLLVSGLLNLALVGLCFAVSRGAFRLRQRVLSARP